MSLTIDTSNRITGLSSGLETETIVEGLMSSYQTKLDKQTQKTTKLEWTADAYRDINKLIKNFRSSYLSVLSETNMMTESAYGKFYASIQTDTNAVSISASASARACTMTIDSISQLAEAANVSSTKVFTGEKYKSGTALKDLELANAMTFDENGALSFSINGETFSFTKDTTVAEMMKEVNSSDAGVTMRFSSLTNGFSLTADTTGSASAINIVNITGNAFAAENSALGISEGVYAGQDAICSIDGIEVTQASNTFSFDGITYTLTDTSDTAIKFSICQDYQGTVDSIVSLNNIMLEINTAAEQVAAGSRQVSDGKHGHVQVVCPSKDGEYSADEGVTVAQAGRNLTSYTHISNIYDASLSKVSYFAHI